MKAIKKIVAVIMCLCMVLGCTSFAAFAAGDTGSITIQNPSDSEATVVGKTFNIYKVFDAIPSGDVTVYSWALDKNGDEAFYDFFFDPTNGVIKEKEANIVNAVDYVASFDEKDGINYRLSQLADRLHTYIEEKNESETIIEPITVSTNNSSDTSVTADNLGFGYYLIYDATNLSGDTSAVRSAVMLKSTTADVTITIKANRPQIQKYVLGNDDVFVKATSVNIGDVVTFKIDLVVPSHNHYPNYKYYVEDTMHESMTLVPDSIVVYKDGAQVNEGEYYDIGTSTRGADIKVDFSDYIEDSFKYPVGTKISIEYKATINGEIEAGIANNNTATLYYSNDPAANNNTPEDTEGSTSSVASVYTYTFVFTKFSEDAHGNFSTTTRLANAKFQVYEVDKDGNRVLIKFSLKKAKEGTPDEHDVYVVDPNGDIDTVVSWNGKAPTEEVIGATHFGGLLGDITIFGLGEGNYEIKETEAPDGYYEGDAPVELYIIDSTDDTGSVTNLTVTGSYEGEIGSIGNANGSRANLLTWIHYANQPGSTLPETGGMGTTLFTIAGIIMMAGAVAFFTLRKRSSVA